MGLSEYLDQLTAQIRSRKARDFVSKELQAHIEDQSQALQSSGLSPEDALSESIQQMGDPVAVGMEMDRIHRPRLEWKLFLMTALFGLLGVGIQYHLTGSLQQLFYLVTGLIIMTIVYFIDYTFIGKFAIPLWFALTAFFIALVFVTPPILGSHQYQQLYLYLYAPVFAGLLFHYRNTGLIGAGKLLLFYIATLFVCRRLIGSLNVALTLTLTLFLMYSVAVIKKWYRLPVKKTLLALWLGAILLPAFLLFFSWNFGHMPSYQKTRIIAMFSPYFDRTGSSYQAAILADLVKGLTLTGNGPDSPLALPLQNGLLPGIQFDFVITYIFSYYGILAGVLLLALFALLFMRIFRISFRQPNQLGLMTGFGCGAAVTLETIHYVAANFGLSATVQLYLPFLSTGLRATIITYVFLGLLLSVYRYKDLV